jgi:hypothetical protein
MAVNWEIDDKPAVITPAITDTFPCTQSGNVRKITTEQILSLADDAVDAIGLQWKLDSSTWTPEATGDANFPEWVINVDADVPFLKVGQKIKYTQTTIKYGIITKVGVWSGSSTPITVYMGGTLASPSYPMTNAAITTVYYSTTLKPLDFPLGLDTWSTILTDTERKIKSSGMVANTWYGGATAWTTGAAITPYIGTGLWNVSYSATIEGIYRCDITLSSSNSTESDSRFTSYIYGYPFTGYVAYKHTFNQSHEIFLAAVTQYWLMVKNNSTYATYINGSDISTIVKVKCLYL